MVDLNSGNIDVPPNMTSWPSFHNGVAAGLKIAPASQVGHSFLLPAIFAYLQLVINLPLQASLLDFNLLWILIILIINSNIFVTLSG